MESLCDEMMRVATGGVSLADKRGFDSLIRAKKGAADVDAGSGTVVGISVQIRGTRRE